MDVNNCDGCGMPCPAVAHGTPKCAASTCAIKACSAPYADCNGVYSDGCETNTDTDMAHCGGCNRPCTPPMTCTAGVCM